MEYGILYIHSKGGQDGAACVDECELDMGDWCAVK
jgi:hypothetical protein